MRLYKLTTADFKTRPGYSNELTWGEGITHTVDGAGQTMCSGDVIHAYEHPLLAVFLNPIHADYKNPVLWECEGNPIVREGQLKCGVKSLTAVTRIPIPKISLNQSIRCAIYIARSVQQWNVSAWELWAEKWLSGEDRSAAEAAEAAAEAGARAAARAAEAGAWAAGAARAADAGEYNLVALIEQAVNDEPTD